MKFDMKYKDVLNRETLPQLWSEEFFKETVLWFFIGYTISTFLVSGFYC